MIRVAHADDHNVVRLGMEQLLGTFDDVEVVGSAAGGREAIELCSARRPDVLLLDLSMPDVDGIEVTRRLPNRHHSAKRPPEPRVRVPVR